MLALGYRAHKPGEEMRAWVFDARQLVLVGWTLVAAVVAVAVYEGLLGQPEMQVRGNGSTASLLRWFSDRTAATLPSPWMITVPILAPPQAGPPVAP
jgi:hypothetical protein